MGERALSTPDDSSVATKFARAMRLHCPRCGGGKLRRSWFKLTEHCPTCGLALERGEEDYWIGAYAINMVVGEGIAAVVGITLLWLEWPNTTPGMIVGIALAIAMPILFFPFSRLLWLAWDLSFRPTEPGDLAR